MSNKTTNINFVTFNPASEIVFASNNVDDNTTQAGALNIVMDSTYAELRLVGLGVRSINVATLPTVTVGIRCVFSLFRGGQQLFQFISSKGDQQTITTENLTSFNSHQWDWSHDELSYLPIILPADTINIRHPPLDIDGSPTGDIQYDVAFRVVRY